jgi:hypothetical protein
MDKRVLKQDPISLLEIFPRFFYNNRKVFVFVVSFIYRKTHTRTSLEIMAKQACKYKSTKRNRPFRLLAYRS